MSKHTPGPWAVHEHGHANGEQWLSVLHGAWDITHNYASRPGVVADAAHSAMSDATNLANARLIAAAPDLFYALKMCIQRIERPELSPGADVVLERSHEAIAKATGAA